MVSTHAQQNNLRRNMPATNDCNYIMRDPRNTTQSFRIVSCNGDAFGQERGWYDGDKKGTGQRRDGEGEVRNIRPCMVLGVRGRRNRIDDLSIGANGADHAETQREIRLQEEDFGSGQSVSTTVLGPERGVDKGSSLHWLPKMPLLWLGEYGSRVS